MTEKELRLLAKASIVLDKLQVELCSDTPYPTPTTEEVRERILKAIDYIDEMLPDYNDSEDENYEDDCWEALSSIGDMDFNY